MALTVNDIQEEPADRGSAAPTAAVYPADCTELDTKAVDTARILAADAVEKVGNGHPGGAAARRRGGDTLNAGPSASGFEFARDASFDARPRDRGQHE